MGRSVHLPATETWSTLHTVSGKEHDFRVGPPTLDNPHLTKRGNSSTIVGVPAGPGGLQANSVAVGSGTLTTTPSRGKASQSPQGTNMDIKKHLTNCNCFLEKRGIGQLCHENGCAESARESAAQNTGRGGVHWGLSFLGLAQVTHEEALWGFYVLKSEPFRKRSPESSLNQDVGTQNRTPLWALLRGAASRVSVQRQCPVHGRAQRGRPPRREQSLRASSGAQAHWGDRGSGGRNSPSPGGKAPRSQNAPKPKAHSEPAN